MLMQQSERTNLGIEEQAIRPEPRVLRTQGWNKASLHAVTAEY
jgi:hypothetical protein